MATIDIRDGANDGPINCIIFGRDDACIELEKGEPTTINVYGQLGQMTRINKDEINNLVKAIDKAKELGWFD